MTGRPRSSRQRPADAWPDRRPVEVLVGRSAGRHRSAFSQRGPQPHSPANRIASSEIRQVSAGRSRRTRISRRRFGSLLGIGAVVIVLVAILRGFGKADSFPVPTEASLSSLSVPQRIVAIAQSQVGYRTEPSNSYCNKFSAYWAAGTGGCPSGESAEEWCADFAAWAWQKAGVPFTYGYGPGEIDGGAVSFYEWGIANGEWHPAASGFVASPGDVAVYGLSLGTDPSATHVAIVTDDQPGEQGPDVVNGDGDRTGFSVVENGTDQARADTGHGTSVLAGYVSPP
jgi:CHAP domain-containing protein